MLWMMIIRLSPAARTCTTKKNKGSRPGKQTWGSDLGVGGGLEIIWRLPRRRPAELCRGGFRFLIPFTRRRHSRTATTSGRRRKKFFSSAHARDRSLLPEMPARMEVPSSSYRSLSQPGPAASGGAVEVDGPDSPKPILHGKVIHGRQLGVVINILF